MLSIVVNVLAAAASVLLQTGTPCPEVSWDSLLADPAVQKAMSDAWTDTKEGTPGEKEQGAHIYQCASTGDDGSVEWVTVVERWPADKAKNNEITPPPPNPGPGCRTVGEFHTHPGPADEAVPGKPNWVQKNQKPSDSDELIAALGNKVPSFIVYGDGPDWKGDVTKYGWGAAQTPCPPDNDGGGGSGSGSGSGQGSGSGSGSGSTSGQGSGSGSGSGAGSGQGSGAGSGSGTGTKGESSGDPHMRTFDGFSYDMMAAGEFVVVRSTEDDFEIQARQQPISDQSLVTGNTRIAVRLDGATIDFSQEEIVVDGKRRPMTGIEDVTTSGGGRVTGGPGNLTVTWSDGSVLRFTGRSFVVTLADARRGKVEGLLGNADGDKNNDLVGGGHALLDDGVLLLGEVYDDLASNWRVTGANSLFTYANGTSTDDFDLKDFPRNFVTFDMLDPAVRAEAEAKCKKMGLEDPTRIVNCTVDLAVSDDESWAEDAALVAKLASEQPPSSTGTSSADTRPLIDAAGRGDLPAVQALLAHGIAVDAVDEEGRSALHWAVLAADLDVTRALLAAGANPNQVDDRGESALHIAAFWGFNDIATALVDAGADRHLKNDNGETPADEAAHLGHADLADELK